MATVRSFQVDEHLFIQHESAGLGIGNEIPIQRARFSIRNQQPGSHVGMVEIFLSRMDLREGPHYTVGTSLYPTTTGALEPLREQMRDHGFASREGSSTAYGDMGVHIHLNYTHDGEYQHNHAAHLPRIAERLVAAGLISEQTREYILEVDRSMVTGMFERVAGELEASHPRINASDRNSASPQRS